LGKTKKLGSSRYTQSILVLACVLTCVLSKVVNQRLEPIEVKFCGDLPLSADRHKIRR